MIEIPDQETRDMLIEAGFLPKGSKAKSIRAVAARRVGMQEILLLQNILVQR